MPLVPTGEQLLATILKHDSKTTSYKFALLRALNDVVLGHPDLALMGELPVAVPLGCLADWWLAYYCSFANPERPILQGRLARRGDTIPRHKPAPRSGPAARRLTAVGDRTRPLNSANRRAGAQPTALARTDTSAWLA
jgi:hypothetical protein